MSRVTLDLPEPLHQLLTEQAEREGISLQAFILYSLSRIFTTATAVDLEQQRALFEELLSRYPQEDAEAALQDLLSRRR
jgi:hypothetical protein